MNTKQKNDMYNRIAEHGENLKAIFNLAPETNPIALCKALRRIEARASRAAVDYCNGVIWTEQYDKKTALIEKALDKVLNYKAQNIPVQVNGDPRGYMLQIDDRYTRELRETGKYIKVDFGGCGLIAPDLTRG